MKPAALLLAGVLIALIAHFPLEGWADQTDLAHWIQHGLLFWGGIVAGWGAVLLYRSGQRGL